VRLNEVLAVLDDRLRAHVPAPVAVAFSGGGDSLALLLIAQAWAKAHGRRLVVLSVDHGLQPQGAAWVESCAAVAARLGVAFRPLAWTGPKPERGVPAAARAARHRLLAEAARDAGARVILLGHTADDRLEAQAMREAGATTPDPAVWAPSPVWPEGRGLFLLRPLLGVRREALRDWLRAREEAWVEDPANADPRSARARARTALAGRGTVCAASGPAADAAHLAAACDATSWGGLSIARGALREAEEGPARRFLAAACLCAGGTSRPPRGDRLQRLLDAVRGERPVTATLGGSRIEADGEAVRLMREPGEAARGGLAPCALPLRHTVVWDGRYEVVAARNGLSVRPLAGLAARLADRERRALPSVPAAARGALPAIVGPQGVVSCPVLWASDDVQVTPLVGARLDAACGAVAREPV